MKRIIIHPGKYEYKECFLTIYELLPLTTDPTTAKTVKYGGKQLQFFDIYSIVWIADNLRNNNIYDI